MNEMLLICIYLLKAEFLLFKPLFLYYCSSLGRPPFFFNNIFEKCEITCSLMPLILKLHFHVKSVRYFNNGRYKLAAFWMIIQWTRSNLHKESFRVRTINTIINNTLFGRLRKTTINNRRRFLDIRESIGPRILKKLSIWETLGSASKHLPPRDNIADSEQSSIVRDGK